MVISIAMNEEGQATTEYILLIAALVSIFVVISAMIGKMDFPGKISKIVTGPFAATYQYGHPKVLGPNQGGPVMHPRFETGGNFRIFFGAKSQ